MGEKYYQTETEESLNKDCVLVFMKDDSDIEKAAAIIQSFFFVEKAFIADAVQTSTHSVLKAIYAYPKTDIIIQDKVITIQDLKHFIKDVLSDGELLRKRDYLSKQLDVMELYDTVVLKMFLGKFDQYLIKDMHSIWNRIIYHLTGVVSLSHIELLKAIEKLSDKRNAAEWYRIVYIDSVNRKTDSLNMEITRLFAATNEFIMRIYK